MFWDMIAKQPQITSLLILTVKKYVIFLETLFINAYILFETCMCKKKEYIFMWQKSRHRRLLTRPLDLE